MGIINARLKVAAKRIAPGASSDSSYTENVAILPANAYVTHFHGRVVTAFAGLTKPLVSLGVSGDTDRYMKAQPIEYINEFVFGGASISKPTVGDPKWCAKLDWEMRQTSSLPIIATFTSSSSDFSGLTAGEVEFAITYIDPNQYPGD